MITAQISQPAEDSRNPLIKAKLQILREITEALMYQISAVKESRWEVVSEIDGRKRQLLNRLSNFSWEPYNPERDDPEIYLLQAQIVDLEFQVRKGLEQQLQVLETQMDDLMSRYRRWRKFVEPLKG
jgi:hypothetical protein